MPRLALLILIASLTLLTACSDDEDPITAASGDPITDLTATATGPTSVTLTWSAPSAFGTIADAYQIRYRQHTLDATTWDQATVVSYTPLPNAPGDDQQAWVSLLTPGAAFGFAVRWWFGGEPSPLSNVAFTTLPEGATPPDGFAFIPAGTFAMGSPTTEQGRDDDEAQHTVQLTRGFFLGLNEVTQTEYAATMAGEQPSMYQGNTHPVEQVSFMDAIGYCNALSLQEGLTPAYTVADDDVTWDQEADGYRLPTEAEWEYACRAGSQGAFAGGDISGLGCEPDYILIQFGVYCGSDEEAGDVGTDSVGHLRANAWGLRDMHGNVFEWCWDWYTASLHNNDVDPTGPATGAVRVIRGGGWSSPVEACRSASRSFSAPDAISGGVGFRVARNAE